MHIFVDLTLLMQKEARQLLLKQTVKALVYLVVVS